MENGRLDVAQVGNLLYRRLAVGVFDVVAAGRLAICDTADCQSAPRCRYF